MPSRPSLYLSGDPDADKLLSKDPFALLVGMVLDQQVPLEWAFYGPLTLTRRLGGAVTATGVAAMSEDELVAVSCEKPAIHRFPAAMARRVHALAEHIVAEWDGNPANVWRTAETGAELLARIKVLPGFGNQKAKIFVALLGKQLGVQPPGWEKVSAPYSEPGTHMSVADITSAETLSMVRDHKREMKAAAKAASGPTGTATTAGAAAKRPAKKSASPAVSTRAAAAAKKPTPPASRVTTTKKVAATGKRSL